jgi:hypothetical protein
MWWLSVADVAEREVFFFADKAQPAAARIWLLTHHISGRSNLAAD